MSNDFKTPEELAAHYESLTKVNPNVADQPRDDHGRWTKGWTAGRDFEYSSSNYPIQHAPLTEEEVKTHQKISDIVHDEAKKADVLTGGNMSRTLSSRRNLEGTPTTSSFVYDGNFPHKHLAQLHQNIVDKLQQEGLADKTSSFAEHYAHNQFLLSFKHQPGPHITSNKNGRGR